MLLLCLAIAVNDKLDHSLLFRSFCASQNASNCEKVGKKNDLFVTFHAIMSSELLSTCNTTSISPSQCVGLVVGVDRGNLSVILVFSVLCTSLTVMERIV